MGWHFLLQCHACMLSHVSHVRLCATPFTAAHQASLSTGFSGQEYWSGLPFPSLIYMHTHTHTHIYIYICNTSQVVQPVKNLPANAGDLGDMGLIPGSGRSPGGGHSNPLQYFCLENPMDRGACRAHVGAKNRTPLKQLSMHAYTHEPLLCTYYVQSRY